MSGLPLGASPVAVPARGSRSRRGRRRDVKPRSAVDCVLTVEAGEELGSAAAGQCVVEVGAGDDLETGEVVRSRGTRRESALRSTCTPGEPRRRRTRCRRCRYPRRGCQTPGRPRPDRRRHLDRRFDRCHRSRKSCHLPEPPHKKSLLTQSRDRVVPTQPYDDVNARGPLQRVRPRGAEGPRRRPSKASGSRGANQTTRLKHNCHAHQGNHRHTGLPRTRPRRDASISGAPSSRLHFLSLLDKRWQPSRGTAKRHHALVPRCSPRPSSSVTTSTGGSRPSRAQAQAEHGDRLPGRREGVDQARHRRHSPHVTSRPSTSNGCT